MDSIARGFRLARASWGVVTKDRQLLWLPVLSLIGSLGVLAVFALGMAGIGLPDGREEMHPLGYVLVFVAYVALSFVSIFFNAAVIGAATERLEGREASITIGLALARRHVGQIFVWAVVTATVGMLLRTIQQRAGLVGRIVGGLLGVAWSAVTFFVVPVLLYEPLTATEAIRRSAQIFRERWGEQFVGNGAIGLAMFLIGLAVALPLGLLSLSAPAVGIPVLVLSLLAVAAAGVACSGVFNAALYRYATTGEASSVFAPGDLDASFKPRRGFGEPT